ncbi:MAG: hypothetical protein KAH54_10025 [Candidatus Sabulitectum sp.]|nr:hypothetical protein [Candidatus Sabulitectum sp.]
MSTSGLAGGAAYYTAMANAVKAVGSIVKLKPEEFTRILSTVSDPLIVTATGGLFSKWYKYLFAYRGLTFYCKSSSEFMLPGGAQVIEAQKISIPDI